MTEKESDVLKRYAGLAPADIVEIGTFRGGTTALLLDNSIQVVWTIDVYGNSLHYRTPDIIWLKGLQASNRGFVIVGRCEDIGKYWCRPVGLLVIDGGHEKGYPQRDFYLWSPFVVEGGYVVLHDAGDADNVGEYISQMGTKVWQYDDPHAVAMLMQNSVQWRQCELVDTMYIFQKETEPGDVGDELGREKEGIRFRVL